MRLFWGVNITNKKVRIQFQAGLNICYTGTQMLSVIYSETENLHFSLLHQGFSRLDCCSPKPGSHVAWSMFHSARLLLSGFVGGNRKMIMDDCVTGGPHSVTACGRAMIHSPENHHGNIVIGPLLQLICGLISKPVLWDIHIHFYRYGIFPKPLQRILSHLAWYLFAIHCRKWHTSDLLCTLVSGRVIFWPVMRLHRDQQSAWMVSTDTQRREQRDILNKIKLITTLTELYET